MFTRTCGREIVEDTLRSHSSKHIHGSVTSTSPPQTPSHSLEFVYIALLWSFLSVTIIFRRDNCFVRVLRRRQEFLNTYAISDERAVVNGFLVPTGQGIVTQERASTRHTVHDSKMGWEFPCNGDTLATVYLSRPSCSGLPPATAVVRKTPSPLRKALFERIVLKNVCRISGLARSARAAQMRSRCMNRRNSCPGCRRVLVIL